MGRLLEIARSLPVVRSEPKVSRTSCAVSAISAVSPPQGYKEPVRPIAFDPAASAVLGILVHAGQPVLHTAIVAKMIEKGFDKATAKRAIASCQAKRWIEHNMTTGYILGGEDNPKEDADE